MTWKYITLTILTWKSLMWSCIRVLYSFVFSSITEYFPLDVKNMMIDDDDEDDDGDDDDDRMISSFFSAE